MNTDTRKVQGANFITYSELAEKLDVAQKEMGLDFWKDGSNPQGSAPNRTNAIGYYLMLTEFNFPSFFQGLYTVEDIARWSQKQQVKRGKSYGNLTPDFFAGVRRALNELCESIGEDPEPSLALYP